MRRETARFKLWRRAMVVCVVGSVAWWAVSLSPPTHLFAAPWPAESPITAAYPAEAGQDPVDAPEEPSASKSPASVKYSEAIYAKAEKILADHGLKRVGSQIQPESQGEYARLLADEPRLRRTLRMAREAWEAADQGLESIEQQMADLETLIGNLNAQFAVVGNPQGRNNELVARINASSAQLKQLDRARNTQKEDRSRLRVTLNEEEEKYAELILKMRREVDRMAEIVKKASEVKDVQTAFQVLATRYESPAEIDAESMLAALDRRVRKLEESIFGESIPLESAGGGLKVRAVIGLEPVVMLVDSGASIVLIPQELAAKLDIKPEDNAKTMTMVTADGRRISAKEIFLPRLRVGQFEVEKVRAALLEESVPGAEPLLGMSFLERFKFEVDAGQKTLTLSKVETK